MSAKETSIRVWRVDAPERNEAAFAEATQALSALIAGQQLGCRQRDIDRNGRIVGQCFLPDGSPPRRGSV